MMKEMKEQRDMERELGCSGDQGRKARKSLSKQCKLIRW
jgi:hypothetical protein